MAAIPESFLDFSGDYNIRNIFGIAVVHNVFQNSLCLVSQREQDQGKKPLDVECIECFVSNHLYSIRFISKYTIFYTWVGVENEKKKDNIYWRRRIQADRAFAKRF